jgi:hypothetical protein
VGAADGAGAAARAAVLVVGTAVSTKILSSQTTGVAEPWPGTSTFHFTFFFSLHSLGGSLLGATPVSSGPRHCGQ